MIKRGHLGDDGTFHYEQGSNNRKMYTRTMKKQTRFGFLMKWPYESGSFAFNDRQVVHL